MKKFKKLAVIGVMVLAISVTSITAFAYSYETPADVVADLKGETVESILSERRQTGKTYGQIANEIEKLEEFQDEILKIKKAILDERVAAGLLTQKEADEILKALEVNQAFCYGLGGGIGRRMGIGFGRVNGYGRGMGWRFCR